MVYRGRLNAAEVSGLEVRARELRSSALRLIAGAGSGHPGPALSIADIIATLYYRVLRVSSASVDAPDRDRFVLSKGHGCASLYAALLERGFVDPTEAARFRSHGGSLQGHPRASVPGIEATTGPLGIGASIACGLALEGQRTGFRVFALLGDGEMQAGIVWEAALFAAHHRLANLTYIIDINGLQYTGPTAEVMSIEPLADKFTAFGWEPVLVDGHDVGDLAASLERRGSTRPRALLARTIKGKGVSFMENALGWHGKAPTEAELSEALVELSR